MSNTTTERDHARDQAQAQLSSIVGYVAALQCDYDRLEELREERAGYVESLDGPPEMDTPERWAEVNPEDAAALAELTAEAGECESEEDARESIQEDPLSVEVRSDWHGVGESSSPSEFCILLCTGGPAVRIVGDLDDNMEPSRPRIEYQDWGTPWTEYCPSEDTDGPGARAALLDYCKSLYFGG